MQMQRLILVPLTLKRLHWGHWKIFLFYFVLSNITVFDFTFESQQTTLMFSVT